MTHPIHITAVLLAAVAAFVLGFLFHGPILGKYWMKIADIHPTGKEKFSDMVPQLFWNLVVNIVTACGLAIMYSLASSSPALQGAGVWGGVACGILAWAGFLVPSSSIEVIWMNRKRSLWVFESGCSFVVMAVMGAIIAYF